MERRCAVVPEEKETSSPTIVNDEEPKYKMELSKIEQIHEWRKNIHLAQIKIIDFNSSRMFSFDESPLKLM